MFYITIAQTLVLEFINMRNRKKYPADWFERIRPEALRLGKYRCHNCHAGNHKKGYYNESDVFVHCDSHMIQWAASQGIKIITVHLQVAHLDQDTTNNTQSNLRVYCPRHHLVYDHQYRKVIKKGNPAPG